MPKPSSGGPRVAPVLTRLTGESLRPTKQRLETMNKQTRCEGDVVNPCEECGRDVGPATEGGFVSLVCNACWLKANGCEGDTPSRSPELEFCERCRSYYAGERCSCCDYCGGAGVLEDPCIEGVTEPCPQCSQEEPDARPLPDQYVDPPGPESLAERAGRLEREHGEMRRALDAFRQALWEQVLTAQTMRLDSALSNANDLLDRIETRENGG